MNGKASLTLGFRTKVFQSCIILLFDHGTAGPIAGAAVEGVVVDLLAFLIRHIKMVGWRDFPNAVEATIDLLVADLNILFVVLLCIVCWLSLR